MPQPTKSTSPWVWVAAGCGCAVLVAVLAVGGMGFFGYRWAKQVESEIKNPEQRRAKVLEVLGVEQMPTGYFPVMGLSIPFVMEMAILSDREPPPGDVDTDRNSFDERGLFYIATIQSGRDRQRIQDYFDGKTHDLEGLRQAGLSFGRGDVVSRGTLTLPGAETRYVAERGEVSYGHSSGKRSITALALIDCAKDSRMRLAIWFGPDPAPDAPVESLDLAGTPADEAALTAFLGQFRLCGAGS